MRCPFCISQDTNVKDSRPTEDNSAIRRRRFCENCGARFTTFERVQIRDLMVVKKSGRKVPFDRDKLARSIQVATRKRQIEAEKIETVVSSIIRQLETSGESEIQSEEIGAQVMDALAQIDAVAFVRYASVYKNFRQVNDFSSFIRDLKSEDKA